MSSVPGSLKRLLDEETISPPFEKVPGVFAIVPRCPTDLLLSIFFRRCLLVVAGKSDRVEKTGIPSFLSTSNALGDSGVVIATGISTWRQHREEWQALLDTTCEGKKELEMSMRQEQRGYQYRATVEAEINLFRGCRNFQVEIFLVSGREGICDDNDVITHDIMTARFRYACLLCFIELHRNRMTLLNSYILLLSITLIMDMHLPTCRFQS